MFEGDFEIPAFGSLQWSSLWRKERARLAKYDLAKLVGKLDGDLHVGERAVASVLDLSGKSRDLLVQKTLGLLHGQILDLEIRRISLFRGAER